jgi:hypothetical protein
MREKIAVAPTTKNRPWSLKDIDDLKRCLRAGMPLGKTVGFLDRMQADVWQKPAELKLLSGVYPLNLSNDWACAMQLAHAWAPCRQWPR